MATSTQAQRAFFQRLCDQWGGADSFVELPSTVAFKRTKDTEAIGWRTHLPTDFLGKDRTLDIVVTTRFPEEMPQLWIDPNPFLEWPHAESDGKLCLWPPGQVPVWLSATEFANEMIHLLRRLIKMVQSGAHPRLREAEFASEWTSYWSAPKKPRVKAPGTVLLLDPPAERPAAHYARIVSATGVGDAGRRPRSGSFIISAQTSTDVDRWIKHSTLPSASQDSVAVLIVPLHSAPTTPGAPGSLEETESFIEKWATDHEAASVGLGTMLADVSSMSRWLVFVHGDTAWVGLRFVPRKAASRARGRQNAKTRKHNEASRKRIGFDVDVAEVQRADAAWLQERAMNALTRPLISSRVALIGCGSLGSMVSENLALAGIGNLTLIDPGVLETANIGRHALGIAAVGSAKVFSMRARLLSDYPHITVTAFDQRVQVDDTGLRNSIKAADLVICTTADPECEAYLMASLRAHDIKSLILAWSEPHALAGHSAHSPGEPYVLESLFVDGRCIHPATRFPASPTIPIPGCGESHIPGAGNRIRLIASTVVEHALDVLLETGGVGEHRTWLAASQTIEAHGGTRLLPPKAGDAIAVVRSVPRMAEPKDATVAV